MRAGRRSRLTAGGLGLLVALTVVTSGCDDGGDEPSALDELCAATQERAAHATESFNEAIEELADADAAADPQAYNRALRRATATAGRLVDSFDDFQVAVAELDLPGGTRAALDRYLEALAEQRDLTQALRDAVAADDGTAFDDALDALERARADDVRVRTDAAEELEAPACAPDG